MANRQAVTSMWQDISDSLRTDELLVSGADEHTHPMNIAELTERYLRDWKILQDDHDFRCQQLIMVRQFTMYKPTRCTTYADVQCKHAGCAHYFCFDHHVNHEHKDSAIKDE